MSTVELYFAAIGISALISVVATPLVRYAALRFGWLDRPGSRVKTHTVATPSLGGIAIWGGFTATLLLLRLFTTFPTGTLRSLRAMVTGGLLVFVLGVIDDLKKPAGLHFKPKFGVQILAAALLVYYDMRIHFISPDYLAIGLTLFWVVGICNALNIIDIMDGLCASQAAIAAAAFLLIALPGESVYVNFGAAALLGSTLGFLPWNFSKNHKIFMGDSGSLFLGFELSALALGTSYTRLNPLGVYAPLFILLVPMFDTFFVMAVRMIHGRSPFLGSRDHFALRLEAMGFTRPQIVALAGMVAGILSLCAFVVTQVELGWAIAVYLVICSYIAFISWKLYQIRMKH
ncbi:MAG: undecaprenyl/decaprenyl-phosphate alpha-N-acetylglucosaminyl 1-phosphate transferase [Elusimicrobia bacterium]|nr:undecaprenyl/decaprenyl-phosphate alpha-N-acetylglucosaminyl 1-phosphate transferase [Elusimicrobiota bacterium]